MSTSAIFDNLGSIGANKGDVGDYAHAAATYLRNNYRLAPKTKFLYHVNIELNPTALASLGLGSSYINKKELNLLVNTVELPRYTIDTDVKNQYNRKKVVQTKLRYDPVRLQFHDDRQGITTLFWESYFRYYYQDPAYNNPNNFKTNNMYNNSGIKRYGLDKTNKLNTPFIKSLKVAQLYSLGGNPQFTAFTLVNPIISSWEHDEMDQSNGNTFVKNTMRIEYESVFYERDNSGVDSPAGFRDPSHYDTGLSGLSTGGGQSPTLVDDWTNIFEDLIEGNIDLGTLLSGFRILNNDLPTNNTNFSTPNTPTNIPPTVGGQNNFAFPRSNSFSDGTSVNQLIRGNLQNNLSQETRTEIANRARTNRQFGERLGNTALNVLPTNSFPSELQSVANDIALAGNINDKNQIFNQLSDGLKQTATDVAIDNLPNLVRRLSV